jgi:hypothetical protein
MGRERSKWLSLHFGEPGLIAQLRRSSRVNPGYQHGGRRQTYILCQIDPYKQLKTSLKAEIDQETW